MDATQHNAIAGAMQAQANQQNMAAIQEKLDLILALLQKPVVEVEGSPSGEGMEAPRKKVK